MDILSVSDYRKNLAGSFDRSDNGETVFIRRKGKIYALIKVGRTDLIVTPELRRRIAEAEKACREGRCVSCGSLDELDSFLNSL